MRRGGKEAGGKLVTLGTHGTSELVLGCDGLRVEGGAVGASRQRLRNLRALGIPERSAREWAGSRKGYWRIAGSAPLQRSLQGDKNGDKICALRP